MKRYDWNCLDAERLQLQVREVTPVVRQERQFALRDALLERFPSDTESAATAGSHRRGNAWHH